MGQEVLKILFDIYYPIPAILYKYV